MSAVDPFQIPPMPNGWEPTRTLTHRRIFAQLSDAERRTWWFREQGWKGATDQDGYPAVEPHCAEIPGSWWIALDGGGDSAVWAPDDWPNPPRLVLSRLQVPLVVWSVFAAALPNRGDCTTCTATPCSQHEEG